MSSNLKILVIGSGFITEHYLKAISANNIKCVVVGRGEKNVNLNALIMKYNTKYKVLKLNKFLISKTVIPSIKVNDFTITFPEFMSWINSEKALFCKS